MTVNYRIHKIMISELKFFNKLFNFQISNRFAVPPKYEEAIQWKINLDETTTWKLNINSKNICIFKSKCTRFPFETNLPRYKLSDVHFFKYLILSLKIFFTAVFLLSREDLNYIYSNFLLLNFKPPIWSRVSLPL